MIEQALDEGARPLSVERSSDATTYPVAWRLFSVRGVSYYATQINAWTWTFHPYADQPGAEHHVLDFTSPSLPGSEWPSDETIMRIALESYRANQNWLHTYLRWLPLLIACSTPPSADKTEVYRWRALLSVISAEIADLYTDPSFKLFENPSLDEIRWHLTRLAYCAVADYYEIETDPATPQRYILASLRRWFHRWQSMILSEKVYTLTVTGPPQWMNPPKTADSELPKAHAYSFKPEVDLSIALENGMQEVLFTAQTSAEEARDKCICLRLRRFFRQERQGQRYARELVRRWWLPRYDLDGAEKIKYAIYSAEEDTKRGGYLANWLWPASLSRWVHRVLLLIGLLYCAIFAVPAAANLPVTWLVGLIYVLGLLQIPHWIWNHQPDTSLPRLRAGMLLAVVGTVLQQNWDNLLDFSYRHAGAMLVIAALLALVSFQVLLAKVTNTLRWEGPVRTNEGGAIRNRVAQVLWSAPFQRSFLVFRREMSMAFLFSIVLVDLMGGSYVEQERVTVLTNLHLVWPTLWAPGLLSVTYPSLVLFFSAILLFAGIFSQILWDEKPMTEALI